MAMISQPSPRPEDGPGKGRRTQEERSAETRTRLLEATIECLAELGWSHTTTTVVAERAGVSRGAQLHHFPSKADLVTSAVEHLANMRGAELVREAGELASSGDRISAATDLLWSSFSGPLFYAALELWVAARTDAELREKLLPIERRLGKAMRRLYVQLFGDLLSGAALDGMLQLTLHLMRGMALARVLKEDDTKERELLETWKWTVTSLFEGSPRR